MEAWFVQGRRPEAPAVDAPIGRQSRQLRLMEAEGKPVEQDGRGAMLRRIVVSLAAGVAFLLLDAILNANPVAQHVYAAYRPIAQ